MPNVGGSVDSGVFVVCSRRDVFTFVRTSPNTTVASLLDLELLRRYCMEQGEVRLLKRGEIFEDAGKPSKYVAYVERGCSKYMVNNEEEGKDYCTGFAF